MKDFVLRVLNDDPTKDADLVLVKAKSLMWAVNKYQEDNPGKVIYQVFGAL